MNRRLSSRRIRTLLNGRLALLSASLGVAMACAQPLAVAQPGYQNFLQLSLEELLELKISTVSRRDQILPEAPASIYVITREAIINSGATTLPQVLRLAPNLHVAQIDSGRYAISARGFNALVANKLLVLLDGRTIYTPLFAGVFWDQYDYLLADIERIEVVSGPGATMWGSNAVNGVINIVTREASDTQGIRLSAHGGNLERGAEFRYGGGIGESGHFRVYGKTMHSDNSERENGTSILDELERHQLGFRADWRDTAEINQVTLQGDVYEGRTQDRGTINDFELGAVEWSGVNLLARWSRQLDGGSHVRLQTYWDHSKRTDRFLFQPRADIVDIDFQHSIPWQRHQLLWGAGYRHAKDRVRPGVVATFVPDRRELHWETLYIQDHIRLHDKLEATLGLRAERNSYTGTEYLPNIRIAWTLSRTKLLWTSLSRAVRAPSRFDREVFYPAPPNSLVVGGPDFQSEVAKVAELGFRAQASDRLLYSLTAFYHDWNGLRSGTAIPVEFVNGIDGSAYGLGAWGSYQTTANWRLSAGGTVLEKDLHLRPGSTDPVGVDNTTLANDPPYHFSLRSTHQIRSNLLMNFHLRRVGRLETFEVPAYSALDAHLNWKVNDQVSVQFTGRNLNGAHREFQTAANGIYLQREALVGLTWTP